MHFFKNVIEISNFIDRFHIKNENNIHFQIFNKFNKIHGFEKHIHMYT